MKFAQGTHKKIVASDFECDDVALLLGRIEAALPHLIFGSWKAVTSQKPFDAAPCGEVLWKERQTVEVSLWLDKKLRVSAIGCRHSGPVSSDDYQFLLHLASEASLMLHSRLGGALSLIDFGTLAVAGEMERVGGIDSNAITPILRFVRALAHETYENQRLSYGLILTNRKDGEHPISEAFENKRLKRLTDGFSTALLVDGAGNISGYAPLTTPERESAKLTRRPWWIAGLADSAEELNGVGVALVRSGEMAVVHRGRLWFSQRSGRWQIWNHAAILSKLKDLWPEVGQRLGVADKVLRYLYHVALDLSFRRSGGLLVVVTNPKKLRSGLSSLTDHVGGKGRGAVEQALDKRFAKKKIHTIDRRIFTDLASLDGAVIVDRVGKLLAYGAMTKPAGGTNQGARTRAAVGISRLGVAIKISSDGQISFFANGEKHLEL
ncbi:diadenylate cyclase [Ralstonia sp. 22111]|uniref:diadenylate cyclase n=1 Tax=Ralstonia sp. 22111 TaxID=3453878 RepID=UPI003F849AB1